jgi:hypothetical protein
MQAPMLMEPVVLTHGTVGEFRVVRSLDKSTGLLNTVRDRGFTPGKENDIVVPVVVAIQMSFTVRK